MQIAVLTPLYGPESVTPNIPQSTEGKGVGKNEISSSYRIKQ